MVPSASGWFLQSSFWRIHNLSHRIYFFYFCIATWVHNPCWAPHYHSFIGFICMYLFLFFACCWACWWMVSSHIKVFFIIMIEITYCLAESGIICPFRWMCTWPTHSLLTLHPCISYFSACNAKLILVAQKAELKSGYETNSSSVTPAICKSKVSHRSLCT